MYPELFRIGDFPINTYGVLLAAGLLLALVAAARLAESDGLPKERIYDLGLWTIIGGLLGSKALMFFVEPNIDIFTLDFLRSGGVYYGGFIGGFLALAVLIRWYKLPFWKVADAFAPGVALGQFFGRQGCFSAGCCWGTACELPWGVQFSNLGHQTTGVPTIVRELENPEQQAYWLEKLGSLDAPLHLHPTQLYESFAMLAVFGFLVYLHRKKKFDGQILIAYGIIYSLIRFSIEFIRDDPRGDLFGLTSMTNLSTSQIISLVVAISCIIFLYFRLKKAKETEDVSTEIAKE